MIVNSYHHENMVRPDECINEIRGLYGNELIQKHLYKNGK